MVKRNVTVILTGAVEIFFRNKQTRRYISKPEPYLNIQWDFFTFWCLSRNTTFESICFYCFDTSQVEKNGGGLKIELSYL